MPVERLTGRLPRWVSDPAVMDWVSAAEVLGLVERERRALEQPGSPAPGPVLTPEEAGRAFAFVLAHARRIAALDAAYGVDAWPTSWAGAPWRWETGRRAPGQSLLPPATIGPSAALIQFGGQ